MARQTTTSDLGLAIRDFLEDGPFLLYDAEGDQEGTDRAVFIDVSDPDNPVFHLESGAQFTVRVVRTG